MHEPSRALILGQRLRSVCLLRELVGEHFHQETVVQGTDLPRSYKRIAPTRRTPTLSCARIAASLCSHAGIANRKFHG